VREAGGMVTAFHDNGDPVFGRDILATNGRTHGEMLNVIRRHYREQK
ncbi:MAG: hypothetical protein JNM00_03305, partial [Flavobacteriales bacterium]|nr:hypothetical protein [Flavobacteriales bacterium]